jgi:TRAP-type mannitol/chloroaromatic compound transport system permease large subunit
MPLKLSRLLTVLILLALWSGAVAATPASAELSPPNIVIIVADDLGWADVGYYGSSIRTPNIDCLVRLGVELDRFYVYPVCSPTRAGLPACRLTRQARSLSHDSRCGRLLSCAA